MNKTRGKSGPLFNFDVHDDVRLVSDATKEKDESHAGKVCERSWYNRSKNIFPAVRWEVYDPDRDYGTYVSICSNTMRSLTSRKSPVHEGVRCFLGSMYIMSRRSS